MAYLFRVTALGDTEHVQRRGHKITKHSECKKYKKEKLETK